jgi:hypothetical protein
LTLLAAVLSTTPSSSTMNDVEPGLIGFLIVAALGVALVFLLRSMNKQFRKLGPPPEESGDTAADEAATGEAAGPAAQTGAGDAPAKGAKRR